VSKPPLLSQGAHQFWTAIGWSVSRLEVADYLWAKKNERRSSRSLQSCGGTVRKEVDGIREEKFRGSWDVAVKSSRFLPVSLLTKGCAIKGRLLLQLGGRDEVRSGGWFPMSCHDGHLKRACVTGFSCFHLVLPGKCRYGSLKTSKGLTDLFRIHYSPSSPHWMLKLWLHVTTTLKIGVRVPPKRCMHLGNCTKPHSKVTRATTTYVSYAY
jgi:hypothetical protein